MEVGIEPLSSFWDKAEVVNLVRFPIVVGIDPESWLPIRESVDKAARCPVEAGIEPLSSFWDKAKVVSLVRFPIVVGIAPVRLLFSN